MVADSQTPHSEPSELLTSEDWWAIWLGAFLICVAFLTTYAAYRNTDALSETAAAKPVPNPLQSWIARPGGWESNPTNAFFKNGKSLVPGITATGLALMVLFLVALPIMGKPIRQFPLAFAAVFVLAVLAYVMAGQAVVRQYNLEYVLWALLVGLIISNTVGTPTWLMSAVHTEFYIKTGLVLLGAEVLMSRLFVLGVPGIFVSWVVTPVVLVATFIFGQKVLKMTSPSLNMVIAADMSVCGVSAAIATAAACKAKKEELSLAIGLSLTFTVLMMIVQPAIIRAVGMDEVLAGAWLGGTIDSTGAVAAAGAFLGDKALQVAATVKMIQNILIGVVAFFVAIYWVQYVEKADGDSSRPGVIEIWRRFPKFVLGFVAVSCVFSIIYSSSVQGEAMVGTTLGVTKTLRGWLFCLAFVSIGLETNFRELASQMRGGKPLILYVAGQSLNLCLSLLMAWLMFGIIFRDSVKALLK